MFHKRERFERIDVPRQSPYANFIGIGVVVAVFVVVAIVVSNVWGRVQLETRLGDLDMSEAISNQASLSIPDGYNTTSDSLTRVLFLTVSDTSKANAPSTLQAARILVVNNTQGTAVLANVPVNVKIVVNEQGFSLADYCAQAGPTACVQPLSKAAGLKFTHVVISTEDVLSQVASLSGAEEKKIFETAGTLMSKIRTDFKASEIIEFAKTLSAIGLENVAPYEAVTTVETATAEDGTVSETGYVLIDKVQMGTAVGLLVGA